MNQPHQKPKVIKEVPAEWDEIMRLAAQIKMGEIIIKVQDGKITLAEYTVKRKPEATDEFRVFPL